MCYFTRFPPAPVFIRHKIFPPVMNLTVHDPPSSQPPRLAVNPLHFRYSRSSSPRACEIAPSTGLVHRKPGHIDKAATPFRVPAFAFRTIDHFRIILGLQCAARASNR